MADVRFLFRVPPDMEGGVYANLLAVWHTAHEFTLDFGATMPPETDPDRLDHVVVPVRATARVKIPPSLAFELIRTINDNMTRFEETYGPIRRPGDSDPLPFPDDLQEE